MILAIDIHYKSAYAKAVGVLFSIADEQPQKIITDLIKDVKDYQSGAFYKRELPCILQLLKQVDLTIIQYIIVDGHVFIDNNKTHGLGGYLWEALNQTIPIVGIAKRTFFNTEQVITPIYRGKSSNPLYLSCIGMSFQKALAEINKLHGSYRIPTILKILDQISKED